MDSRYASPKRLNRFEKQVFSQNGEDGTIAEIFQRVDQRSRTFLEIGVGDGLENNTTYLLMQGWTGSWIEGSAERVATIFKRFEGLIAQGALTVMRSFVTAENISDLADSSQVGEEPDLLSLDIDRNTYYVWRALDRIRPRVVVVEYNATLPASVDWKVEYRADRVWNGTAYFGASLKALELLGRERGYALVGCDLAGVNAFFVRDDLCEDKFEAPYTSENHYEPPRYFLGCRNGHPACFDDLSELSNSAYRSR
jgi:hypothetical protein